MHCVYSQPLNNWLQCYVMPSSTQYYTFNVTQVLCWGVRDMKKLQLLPVDSPLVEVECGGAKECSQHIKDTKKNPNFPQPVLHFDVVSIILCVKCYRLSIACIKLVVCLFSPPGTTWRSAVLPSSEYSNFWQEDIQQTVIGGDSRDQVYRPVSYQRGQCLRSNWFIHSSDKHPR